MPKMTKGHFEDIALTLRNLKPVDGPTLSGSAWNLWRETVREFADLCSISSNMTMNGNLAFDRDRFYAAVGYEP